MAKEFKLPELGENIDEGQVLKVLVHPGDRIAPDQPVIELETEKATVEVPADVGGSVREVRVKEGDTVGVGQVILVFEDQQKEAPEQRAEPERPAEPKREEEAAAAEARREKPEQAKAEEELEKGPPAAKRREPVEEPEAPAEREAPEEAAAPREEREEEEREEPEERREAARRPAPEPAVPPERRPAREVEPAAPSVRRLARELGLDIREVRGTGPGDRITMEDVKDHARTVIARARSAMVAGPAPPRLPDFETWGPVDREPMSGVRRITAQRMSLAWRTVAHVTQHDRADVTELEALRRQYAKRVEEAGGKLTLTAIALKLAASALKVFPKFNASIDPESEEIVFKRYYHIGMAVDTEHGLLVPVIRDVDRKNIAELAVEVVELADRARARKLSREDMQGATFTITNQGGIGGTSFTPIVNWPEVAILGLSRTSTFPVFLDGQLEPRLMLPLSLSYDHRLIDGADAARFLRWLAEAFENPFLVSLEG